MPCVAHRQDMHRTDSQHYTRITDSMPKTHAAYMAIISCYLVMHISSAKHVDHTPHTKTHTTDLAHRACMVHTIEIVVSKRHAIACTPRHICALRTACARCATQSSHTIHRPFALNNTVYTSCLQTCARHIPYTTNMAHSRCITRNYMLPTRYTHEAHYAHYTYHTHYRHDTHYTKHMPLMLHAYCTLLPTHTYYSHYASYAERTSRTCHTTTHNYMLHTMHIRHIAHIVHIRNTLHALGTLHTLHT